jgi:transposase InsO family protein
MTAGSRLDPACAILVIDPRTVQRWRAQGIGDDRRYGPNSPPANKLSTAERQVILEVVNSRQFRDRSPKQIVPQLADEGVYLASESTVYRILRDEDLLAHRGRAKPAQHKRPDELVATGPNQIWSWDITYLPTLIKGQFFYLYMVIDVFSRKIVGRAVHDIESDVHAAVLITVACAAEGIRRGQLVIHSDNGHPMKGATMLATLQSLGIMPSFSRPGVSDDNPYSEALFRTLKYCPAYPSSPFCSLQQALVWVDLFIAWYNGVHLHSAIGFVTPEQRHAGADRAILEARKRIYEAARRRHPERWSAAARSWERTEVVYLNPKKSRSEEAAA